MMRNRRYRNAGYTPAELPLAPLIDTAFALLIIFMVSAPFMHQALKIQLPKGTVNEAATEHEECVVAINHENSYYLNDALVEQSNVTALVKDYIKESHLNTVFVKADRVVPYGRVLELVDQIKQLEGVEYVALSTQAT